MTNEQRLRGVVAYMKDEGFSAYGFITPDHGTCRADDIWFGFNSMQGQPMEVGDTVEFILFRERKPGKLNRSARKVWVTRCADTHNEKITYVGGD